MIKILQTLVKVVTVVVGLFVAVFAGLWQFYGCKNKDSSKFNINNFANYIGNEKWREINTITICELFGSVTLLERIGNFGQYSDCADCADCGYKANDLREYVSSDFRIKSWNENSD